MCYVNRKERNTECCFNENINQMTCIQMNMVIGELRRFVVSDLSKIGLMFKLGNFPPMFIWC